MTASDTGGPHRFRLLATSIAGRSVDVAEARDGEAAHTNGQVVFVSAGGSVARQRSEVVVQSALLGAGSLDQRWVKGLWARPSVARRYLALEGRRVLADLAGRYPLAAALGVDGEPGTATARESLELARSRAEVPDPPEWFGVVKPSRLLAPSAGPGARATDQELRLEFDPLDLPEADDEGDEEEPAESKALKLFENPLFASRALTDYLRKMLGGSRGSADGAAGAEAKVRAVRRVSKIGEHARPLPTRIHFTDDGKPGAAIGVGGALHPEWDVHKNRYRPDWCRVLDFPLTVAADIAAAGVPQDDVLRRRLSRLGLGPKVLRRRPDGDEIDIEPLIELFVDVRSGHSPPENVYLDRRKRARDLGVLILLDASGSVTDADQAGLAVHDHQRRAAATLAATLEQLGDRVAVYAFRSQGRNAVHLPAIKAFGQRFDALGRARLNQLQPSGYTRLGAGIRGAGEILKREAGTPNRLLIVLSDGFPYDNGYEGRYAEADVGKALEELHADGMACLCLSIGTATTVDALERVFGSASYANAAALAELSPRMDELFLSALRRLAVPVAQART
ncbi:nitric oxide reductase activation protein NorD [Actinomadura sp. NTSP31]|uniref:nitric oxide reductase activation protein NorD n=1 Tax=Actinomadura sp. NTSP31 TaxID=1735447 RepID=UPI0035C0D347